MSELTNGYCVMEGGDGALLEPNLEAIERDHLAKTKNIMKAIDPVLAESIIPDAVERSDVEKAAAKIQAHFRGYIARKEYVSKLYEQFEKDEEERHMKQLLQIEEGELLVETHRLKVEVEEDRIKWYNKHLRLKSHIIRIQRAWREYQRRKCAARDEADVDDTEMVVDEEKQDEGDRLGNDHDAIDIGPVEDELVEKDSDSERNAEMNDETSEIDVRQTDKNDKEKEFKENAQNEEMVQREMDDVGRSVTEGQVSAVKQEDKETTNHQTDSESDPVAFHTEGLAVDEENDMSEVGNSSVVISVSHHSTEVLPSPQHHLRSPSFSELEEAEMGDREELENAKNEDEEGEDIEGVSHRQSSLSPTEMLTLGWAAMEMKLEALDATEALSDRHFMSVCDPNRVSTTSDEVAVGDGSPKPESALLPSKWHKQTGLQLVFVDDDVLESSGEETGRSPAPEDMRQQRSRTERKQVKRTNAQGTDVLERVIEVRDREEMTIETSEDDRREEVESGDVEQMEIRTNPFHSSPTSPVVSHFAAVAFPVWPDIQNQPGNRNLGMTQDLDNRLLTPREQFERRRRKPLQREALEQLTLIQLICIVQNLQAQIEGASEVLVEGLVERDEHRTKQSSLNERIGDLTRQARETHDRQQQAQQNSKSTKKRWWKKREPVMDTSK